MQIQRIWSVNNHHKTPIYDFCFFQQYVLAPDGKDVMVLSAVNGNLVRSLNGHKDTVYCIDRNKDDTIFCSGSRDGVVVIWNQQFTSILKFSHDSPILSLRFHPFHNILCSVSESDYGIWISEKKNVVKKPSVSKILCVQWSPDGHHLVFGLFNGSVVVCDSEFNERIITRRNAPIFALCFFSKTRGFSDRNRDIVCVTDWDKKLSFFSLDGTVIRTNNSKMTLFEKTKQSEINEINLDFDPCTVSSFRFVENVKHFSNNIFDVTENDSNSNQNDDTEYLLIGGTNRKLRLFNKNGQFIYNVVKGEDWIWMAKQAKNDNSFIVSDNSGSLTHYSLESYNVSCLDKDTFVFRKNFTNVLVCHLESKSIFCIHCNDLIEDISKFGKNLILVFPSKVVVYALKFSNENKTFVPKIRKKISRKYGHLNIAKDFKVLCSERHFFVSFGKRLMMFSFKNNKEKEFKFDSEIKVMKIEDENIFFGLKNGQVYKINENDLFIVPIINIKNEITRFELSSNLSKIALIDVERNLTVFDTKESRLIYSKKNVCDFLFNSDLGEAFCFSTLIDNEINFKNVTFGVFLSGSVSEEQVKVNEASLRVCGEIVSYKASVLTLLSSNSKLSFVRSTPNLLICEPNSLKIAFFGIPKTDWTSLGIQLMRNGQFANAKKVFSQVKNVNFLYLINELENAKNIDLKNISALCYAFEKKFDKAANIYLSNGDSKRAIDLYTSMHLWSMAEALVERERTKSVDQTYTDSTSGDTLINFSGLSKENEKEMKSVYERHANALIEEGKNAQAAVLFTQIGEYGKAIEIYGENELTENLLTLVSKLSLDDRGLLEKAAKFLCDLGKYENALSIYKNVNDNESVVRVLMKMRKWSEAEKLVKTNPDLGNLFFLSYANYLTENDQFEKAQSILWKAGKFSSAIDILIGLSEDALRRERYSDASFIHYRAYVTFTRLIKHSPKEFDASDEKFLELSEENLRLAEVYFAYQFVHDYVTQPFTSLSSESLFHICRWLAMNTVDDTTATIKKRNIWYTLAKVSQSLKMYNVARKAFENLSKLFLPLKWIDAVEMGILQLKSKPMTDNEQLRIICPRCSSSNPFLSFSSENESKRNNIRCTSCNHIFVYSFWSFDVLPLVEFRPDYNNVPNEEEALKLIEKNPARSLSSSLRRSGNVQTLNFENNNTGDEFAQSLDKYEHGGLKDHSVITISSKGLQNLDPFDVFIASSPSSFLSSRFFKSVIPDIPVVECPHCAHFFHEDDFEVAFLERGCCPFCRTKEIERIKPF